MTRLLSIILVCYLPCCAINSPGVTQTATVTINASLTSPAMLEPGGAR